jgi:hypothetical protein
MNYKISEKDRLYLSGYFGRDKFNFNNAERNFSTTIPWETQQLQYVGIISSTKNYLPMLH